MGLQHKYRKIQRSDDTTVDWDEEERIGTVLHAHSGGGGFHFHREYTASKSIILIDASDIDNWPHAIAGFTHLEALDLQTDPSVTPPASYNLYFYFIDDVTDIDCTLTMFKSVSGTKTAGQVKEIFQNWDPVGPRLHGDRFKTNMVFPNHIEINALTSMGTMLDPEGAGDPVYPANHDIILEVELITGAFWLDVEMAYHTHAVDDPEH